MELLLGQVQIRTRGAGEAVIWEESKIFGSKRKRGNVENRIYNK